MISPLMEKNPSAKTCERLFLVDAHAYLHRAYHALPPLTSPAGKPVGALYGFARMLLSLTRREKPELLVVCFDAPGPTFRHKLFERYKATRKPIDEDLKSQLALSCEMASAMGFSCAQLPGWEADDLIATLARRGRERGADVVIVSGDKDALQLIDDHVRVLNEAKGTMLDDAAVVAKFGVHPAQVGDYLALTGDSSDNVPGVPGIGPVGAVKLLSRFGSLEALLTAAREGHGDIPAKTAE
ncbi:MAG: 5'-3' exonuclease H3TH domain-containing protein, partial [Elusimicrobiota bacterium]